MPAANSHIDIKPPSVEIALAADQNFFNGLLVTAGSIAIFAAKTSNLSFHILDGGINDSDIDYLKNRVREIHPNTTFFRHRVTTDLFAHLEEWRGSGRMTYVRLLLGDILPNLNHVIYCDTDFIWLRDITKLWDMRNDHTYFISVRDGVEKTEGVEAKWFPANGFAFSAEKYFCAGLSFFNLILFRRDKLFEKAIGLLNERQDIYALDQTVLNAVLSNRTQHVQIIDSNWARNTFYLTPEMMSDHPVLHFAGLTPWKNLFQARLLTNQTLLWFKLFAKLSRRSLWRALRMYYSPLRIISSRMIFIAVSNSDIMKHILKFIMSATNMPGTSYEYIRPLMRNIKIPSDIIAQINERTATPSAHKQ